MAIVLTAIATASAWPSSPLEVGGTWNVQAGGADGAGTSREGATRTVSATLRVEAFNPALGPVWSVRTAEATYHCRDGLPTWQPSAAGIAPVRHPWAGGSCSLADSGAPWTPSWQADLLRAQDGTTARALRGSGTFG